MCVTRVRCVGGRRVFPCGTMLFAFCFPTHRDTLATHLVLCTNRIVPNGNGVLVPQKGQKKLTLTISLVSVVQLISMDFTNDRQNARLYASSKLL